MQKQNAWSTFVRNQCHLKEGQKSKKGEKKVKEATALSAILAPKWRNSQRGVRKLLVAVAANEEGLQHSSRAFFVVKDAEQGPVPTLHV